MYRGDDKIYELTVTDKQTGNPVDITGCTITMTLREDWDEAIFLQKTNGAGVTLTDPTNGIAEITIDAADTSGLDVSTQHEYVFDVYILKTTGKGETLLTGKFIVLQEATY